MTSLLLVLAFVVAHAEILPDDLVRDITHVRSRHDHSNDNAEFLETGAAAGCEAVWNSEKGLGAVLGLVDASQELSGSLSFAIQAQVLSGAPPIPSPLPSWWLGVEGSLQYSDKVSFWSTGARKIGFTRSAGGFVMFKSWISVKVPITITSAIKASCPANTECFSASPFKRLWLIDSAVAAHVALRSVSAITQGLTRQLDQIQIVKDAVVWDDLHIDEIGSWQTKFVHQVRIPFQEQSTKANSDPAKIRAISKRFYDLLVGSNKIERFGLTEKVSKLCHFNMRGFTSTVLSVWNPDGAMDGVPMRWRRAEACMGNVAGLLRGTFDNLVNLLRITKDHANPPPVTMLADHINRVVSDTGDLVTLLKELARNGDKIAQVRKQITSTSEQFQEKLRSYIRKVGVTVEYTVTASIGAEVKSAVKKSSSVAISVGTGFLASFSPKQPDGAWNLVPLVASIKFNFKVLGKSVKFSTTVANAAVGKPWTVSIAGAMEFDFPNNPLMRRIKEPIMILAALSQDPAMGEFVMRLVQAFKTRLSSSGSSSRQGSGALLNEGAWDGVSDDVLSVVSSVSIQALIQKYLESPKFQESALKSLNKNVPEDSLFRKTSFSQKLSVGLDVTFTKNADNFSFDYTSSNVNLGYTSDFSTPFGDLNLPATGAEVNVKISTSRGVTIPLDRLCKKK